MEPVLDYETRLFEFANISLSTCEFIQRNIATRHIVFSSLCSISIIYGRFRKIGNFCAQIFMTMFCISIFLTSDDSVVIVIYKIITKYY